MKELSSLEQLVGIKFNNRDLLQQAFVHRSHINEHPEFTMPHNERLEFLGDAVLELIVTDYLYLNHKNPEGELTSWRAALVNSKMLARIGEGLNFNDYLLLSRGEAQDKGRARHFIIADAVEAFIGSIYLDQGFESAKQFIDTYILSHFNEVMEKKLYQDPKSIFQEHAQERKSITPRYEVLKETGPDHDKHFRVGVYLESELIAEGEGASKQDAQEDAARNAMEKKGW